MMTLGRACAISTVLFTPACWAHPVGQLFPTFFQAPTAETGAVERALILLERLQQDQVRLHESLRRLEASQSTSWERQTRSLRQYQSVLAERMSAERDRDRQAMEDLGHLAFTLLLSVAGALLFAMGAVAWSVLRALQRLPIRPLDAQLIVEPGPLNADAQLLGLLAEMERRWLKFVDTAHPSRAMPSPPKTGETPGDFV